MWGAPIKCASSFLLQLVTSIFFVGTPCLSKYEDYDDYCREDLPQPPCGSHISTTSNKNSNSIQTIICEHGCIIIHRANDFPFPGSGSPGNYTDKVRLNI